MGTIAQRDLYRLISEANEREQRVVVATVTRTRGSTPQQRGAKMVFFESGEVAGTVGAAVSKQRSGQKRAKQCAWVKLRSTTFR